MASAVCADNKIGVTSVSSPSRLVCSFIAYRPYSALYGASLLRWRTLTLSFPLSLLLYINL